MSDDAAFCPKCGRAKSLLNERYEAGNGGSETSISSEKGKSKSKQLSLLARAIAVAPDIQEKNQELLATYQSKSNKFFLLFLAVLSLTFFLSLFAFVRFFPERKGDNISYILFAVSASLLMITLVVYFKACYYQVKNRGYEGWRAGLLGVICCIGVLLTPIGLILPLIASEIISSSIKKR